MTETEAGLPMDDMIYSCDDHLDLRAVPVDLWQSRVPKSMAERAPRVVDRDGQATWVCSDRVVGASGKPLANLSAIGRAGLEDDGFRASTTKLRLEDMDRDGVWASVIYGPVPLTLSIPEPDLQDVCYAAWNDWAVEEFNAAAPDRLCVLPFLPSHSPEAAVAELERCAERGHRGALIDAFDFDAGDPVWDRLWAAAEATGLPLVLAEAGVGWLPYFLSRMDMEWENLRDQIDYAPSIPPSELFRHQVIATFEEEKLADQFIPYLGADSCMWASDYPHTDSTFPESRRAIEEALGTLPVEDRRKITALNCKALYRFDDAG